MLWRGGRLHYSVVREDQLTQRDGLWHEDGLGAVDRGQITSGDLQLGQLGQLFLYIALCEKHVEVLPFKEVNDLSLDGFKTRQLTFPLGGTFHCLHSRYANPAVKLLYKLILLAMNLKHAKSS